LFFFQEGLTNIFVKAGAIENVKIIPSKIPDSATTYGFIRYKTKTDAMKAIQMFNNYKFGSQFIKVKFAKPTNSTSTVASNFNGSGDTTRQSNKESISDDNTCWDDDDNMQAKKRSPSISHQSVSDSKYSSTKTINTDSKSRLELDSIVSSTSSMPKSGRKSMGRGQVINSVLEKCKFLLKFPLNDSNFEPCW
jgi:RNA recognition motif-containing protein